jgi:serine/threonine protein kinase
MQKSKKDKAKGKSDSKEGVSEAKKEGSNKAEPVLLAQGTFGCVYHPGMTCNHEPLDAKYITKIHASNERTAQNEIAISKKVQTIPNYELYFSPILENCEVNLAKVNREEVEKCNFIKDDIHRKDDIGIDIGKDQKKPMTYMSTKIRFIEGNSLLEYVQEKKETNKPATMYSLVLSLYNKLCKSVKKLAEKEIVHFDLRENNMIVSKKGEPIIIDFGISVDFEKKNTKKNFLKNTFYAYTTKYKPWCIEIVLICFIVQEKLTQLTSDKIMEIFDEVMEHNDFANKPWLKDHFPKYREHFKKHISTKSPEHLLEYLLSTYKRWDLYSVTVLFIQMLEKIGQEPKEPELIKEIMEKLGFI